MLSKEVGKGMRRTKYSKKELARRRFGSHLDKLRCPVCGSFFSLSETGLYCSRGHNFDLARSGYLNLLRSSVKTQYDRGLFLARREVFARGMYLPLVEKVASLISELPLEHPLILDAGCGEGSFLAQLAAKLPASYLGIDIANDGIRLAAAQDAPVMWCTADLAHLPLADSSLDVVLNILSPANYSEFRRVLKPGGTLIKILPGAEYLQEVRERLDVPPYSNQEVLTYLENQVEIGKRLGLSYQVPLTPELWQAVVEMTPLTFHRRVEGEVPEFLTVELEVLTGTFRPSR